MLSLDCVTADLRHPPPRIMKMIAKLALPDEVADCLADGDHGRLQVGHGVAVLALLVQDDQLAHLHTRGMGTWSQGDTSPAGPRAPECWRWF